MTLYEPAIVEEWLASRLSDATLLSFLPGGAHNGAIPQGRPLPALVFAHLGGEDETTAGCGMARPRYSVRVFRPELADPAPVHAALARVESLLEMAIVETSGARLTVRRNGSLPSRPETGPGGVQIRGEGRIWLITVVEL